MPASAPRGSAWLDAIPHRSSSRPIALVIETLRIQVSGTVLAAYAPSVPAKRPSPPSVLRRYWMFRGNPTTAAGRNANTREDNTAEAAAFHRRVQSRYGSAMKV